MTYEPKDSLTLGKFTPAQKVEQEISKRDELVDSYWAGDFGDVEFFELALKAGMAMGDIEQVMSDVREEDGTL